MMLADAQITKTPGERWTVTTPEGAVLGSFPGSLSNREVIGLLEFSQTYERAAYKEGITTGQESMQVAVAQRTTGLMHHIKQLENHNAMLSQKLEELLTRGALSDGND
jgi:hypothetical protein